MPPPVVPELVQVAQVLVVVPVVQARARPEPQMLLPQQVLVVPELVQVVVLELQPGQGQELRSVPMPWVLEVVPVPVVLARLAQGLPERPEPQAQRVQALAQLQVQELLALPQPAQPQLQRVPEPRLAQD